QDGNFDLEGTDHIAPGFELRRNRHRGDLRLESNDRSGLFTLPGQFYGRGQRTGAKISLTALARGYPTYSDIELLPGDNGCGEVHSEQPGEVLARSVWDRNVGHAAGYLALNGIGISG